MNTPQSKPFSVRLTQDEWDELESVSQQSNLSMGEYLRRNGLPNEKRHERKTIARVIKNNKKELAQLIGQLGQVANDLRPINDAIQERCFSISDEKVFTMIQAAADLRVIRNEAIKVLGLKA